MNTQQAYIDGFVKRASEYGLDKEEAAELLKEGTSLSALKAIIRQLRANGVTVSKDSKAYAKKLFDRLNVEHPNTYTLPDAQQFVANMPPSYNPKDKFVYIPKKIPHLPGNSEAYTKKLNKNYHMSDAIMHEGAGHAIHHIEDPHPLHESIGLDPHNQRSGALAMERIANNNAINFMRSKSVPEHLIENYKQNFANPGIEAYRKHIGWDTASKKSPAFSVENPAITSQGQLDKLYKSPQEITEYLINKYKSKQY